MKTGTYQFECNEINNNKSTNKIRYKLVINLGYYYVKLKIKISLYLTLFNYKSYCKQEYFFVILKN